MSHLRLLYVVEPLCIERFFRVLDEKAVDIVDKTIHSLLISLCKRPVKELVRRDGLIIYEAFYLGILTHIVLMQTGIHELTFEIRLIEVPVLIDSLEDEDVLRQDEVIGPLVLLLQQLELKITETLRRKTQLEGKAPPAPALSDGWHKILTWQHMYFPEMTAERLAETIGVEAQSVRNARNRFGYTNRNFQQRLSLAVLKEKYDHPELYISKAKLQKSNAAPKKDPDNSGH